MSELSIVKWVQDSGIRDERGDPLSFADRRFWLDVLADWSPRIVIKGAAQVGKSVSFTFKTLFAVQKFGMNILYTFPTDDDVREFVASKVNKIIQQNRHVFGELDGDSIERKEINGRFLFFKGTVSKTAAIMTSADIVIHDEASRSNRVAMDTMRSRSKASPYGGRWMFSNPSLERDIIDEEWKKSDMKEWHVSCRACKADLPLKWPDSVDLKNKTYVCSACRAPLTDDDRRGGRWKATNPGAEASGYHVHHLMCPWIPCRSVIGDSEGDPEYFANFVLGEPYSPSDLRVTRSMVLDCWTARKLETGKWFLGVDVGNVKHYVLGSELGVVRFGRFSEWHELDEILRLYRPTAVIDAMPENEVSRSLVNAHPNVSMCYLGRDKESNRVARFGEDEERGVVKADRNRLIDLVIRRMQSGDVPMNVSADAMYRLFVSHCETLRRVKETNNMGISRFVWESTTGEDHLFFALCFYELARMGSDGAGTVIDDLVKKPDPIQMTSDGFTANIEEFMRFPKDI